MSIYDKFRTLGQSLHSSRSSANEARMSTENPDSTSDLNKLVSSLTSEIEKQYDEAPPTIAVIGLSGVGKSSAINAMFGTRLRISATTRGTSEFESVRAKLNIQRGKAEGGIGFLKVYDAPGLGEDRDRDPGYLEMYRRHLPSCDVALWILAARNRALALDQAYLDELKKFFRGKIVFGISQVDLVDPNDWNRQTNKPSSTQQAYLDEIIADRSERLGKAYGSTARCIPFSSTNYFNLMGLYEEIINGAPKERRWMFDFVRSFTSADWLKRAEGITDAQRAEIMAKYGAKE